MASVSQREERKGDDLDWAAFSSLRDELIRDIQNIKSFHNKRANLIGIFNHYTDQVEQLVGSYVDQSTEQASEISVPVSGSVSIEQSKTEFRAKVNEKSKSLFIKECYYLQNQYPEVELKYTLAPDSQNGGLFNA